MKLRNRSRLGSLPSSGCICYNNFALPAHSLAADTMSSVSNNSLFANAFDDDDKANTSVRGLIDA